MRAAFAAVAGAEYYDIYCSTDVDPLWTGRISEVQRAAGCVIDTVGHVGDVGEGGTIPGAVDIWAIGTGLAAGTTAVVSTAISVPTDYVVATGHEYVDFGLVMTTGGDGTAPVLIVIPLLYNDRRGDYSALDPVTITFGGATATYNSLRQRVRVLARGCSRVALAVAKIAGTSPSLDVDVILS